MTNELAKVKESEQPAPALVRYGRPLLSKEVLVEEGQQRQLLMAYVKGHMVEDEDYGVIPGTKRKTLLKPGAEKLTDLFRCKPEFEIVTRIEDFDRPLFHYVFRCRIVSRETGQVVAEGFGSCSSHEKKYRWKTGDRACPNCGQATILRSKYPPRDNPTAKPGWYCFANKGGCGVNFAADDPAIVGQTTGRVENPDAADFVNTILKMAKKRAHVDAAISLARCSDMFTQDAEDFDDSPAAEQYREPQATSHQSPPPPAPKQPHPDPASVKELHERFGKWPAAESGERLAKAVDWVDVQLARLVPDLEPGDLAESVREFLRVPTVADIVKVAGQQALTSGWNHIGQYLGREKDAELKRAADATRG